MTGNAAAGGFALILQRCATVFALAVALLAAQPARALEAVNVRVDVSAIDLTAATDLQKADGDRIQVSTAPGPDGIVRRIEVRAREANTNWAVFALTNNSDEQIDRLIVVPHYRMVGSGLFWPDLGLSRIAAITPSSGDRPVRQENTTARHLPRHARSRHGHHLRRRIAHRQAAADLSVGAGRLQGQGQLLHAVLRHRHRHRRPAGAVPHHPVRGEGLGDVPGRRRARLGGAHLHRHRLRILGQGVRHVGRRRARLARLRRGHPVGDAAGVPVRLSQFVALARALRPHHHRLAGRARCLDRGRGVRSRRRLRYRAHVACRHRGVRARAGHLSLHSRLRPRRAADPDLAAAGGVDRRRRPCCHRRRHQRHHRPGIARRPGADRDADRLHGDAARLRRRHHPRHRLRRRKTRARTDWRRRHDLGLGRFRRQDLHQPGNRTSARPQARHARRAGGGLARDAASARPRPVPRLARQRGGAAARTPEPGASGCTPPTAITCGSR